jgi:RND family efflux transporter MFP subunit
MKASHKASQRESSAPTPSSVSLPEDAPAAPPAGGFRRGGFVVALLLLALAGWISVRVKAAVGGREAVAREHAATAKAAVESASKAPVVSIVRATKSTWQPALSFDGSLAPSHEADIGFKTPGRVASIRVKVGDRVRQGTVLAALDAREAAAQAAAAEAQAQATEAQLALAQDADRRMAAIVSAGSQAEVAGVQTRQQRALAEAQRDAARAQATLAKTNLTNQTLVAPFAGTVSRAPTGAGGVVTPGMPSAPMFHIADLATLKLVGTVGEQDAPLIKVGADVEIDGGPSRGGRRVHGKVSAVVGALDPATRRVPIEAVVVNDRAEPLLSGSLVHATIQGAHAVEVLVLPRSVLRPGSQDEVMVVQGDRLAARRIAYEIARDGSLLVRRGINANDDIVAAPWAEAKDGDRVEVQVAAAEPAAAHDRGAQ